MQGSLFNPGERVRRRKVRVRKQRQCVGTQLEFNTDVRLNNQLRTIGTLPDYLLSPECEQSERTASRLILKLCRSIRRLWDGNTIEEEKPLSGQQWRLIFKNGQEVRIGGYGTFTDVVRQHYGKERAVDVFLALDYFEPITAERYSRVKVKPKAVVRVPMRPYRED